MGLSNYAVLVTVNVIIKSLVDVDIKVDRW